MSYNLRFRMIACDELQQRILDSARNVFSVLADIALEECHEWPDKNHENWVTAMVGFHGAYDGLVALHCPEPLARRIAAGLLYEKGEVALQDVHDAMGEVINILGGDIKLFLDSGGRRIHLSLPSVFAGGEELHTEFLAVPETVACSMAAGDDRLLIGVQVNRGL